MKINTNALALNTMRAINAQQSGLAQTLNRLSSGLRINSAKDDAAGLAISERFTTQIKGLNQAARNLNDAVSLSQTAEGALASMTNLLQRGRELAVQAANATNSSSDKASLQKEIVQIQEELDRIGRDTSFNSVKLIQPNVETVTKTTVTTTTTTTTTDTPTVVQLLSPTEQRILDDLKSSWLQQSETIINDYFGLQADGNVTLKVVLDPTTFASAYVSFFDAPTNTMELHIDVGEFETLYAALDAGNSAIDGSMDQLIAHEMTHAVMAATTNLDAFSGWFTEGTAEFIPGGDARLNAVLTTDADGAGIRSAADVVNNIDNMDGVADPAWTATHFEYATAYVATRYLDSIAPDAGNGGGIPEVLNYLSADGTRTLDDYFAQAGIAGITSEADFVADFKTNGVAFIGGMDLSNNDTGAIGGADANGGARDTTWDGTIPDTVNLTDDPLVGFIEDFPQSEETIIVTTTNTVTTTTTSTATYTVQPTMMFQVGANAGETINVELANLDLEELDLDAVDLVNDASAAIDSFDTALDKVNSARSHWGAIQNRLESAITVTNIGVENISASRSRIQDADFAAETAKLTRSQILQQAANAMLAQASAIPQQVLRLLS